MCAWQGTASSKKKKKHKLQRVMATVKKASRKGQQDQAQSFAAIQLLHDPQVPVSEPYFHPRHLNGPCNISICGDWLRHSILWI